MVSTLAPPFGSVYSGTKGALDTITKSLAKELGPRKIRVNAINPGMVVTEGAEGLGILGSDMEKQDIAATPLGRTGLPANFARSRLSSTAPPDAEPRECWLARACLGSSMDPIRPAAVQSQAAVQSAFRAARG